MKLSELVKKLYNIGDLEVIGAMVEYEDKNENYSRIDYFYNPSLDNYEGRSTEDYIKDMLDVVFFTTYELEEEYMASGKTLFVENFKEVTFRDVLEDNVKSIDFYQPTKIPC